MQKPKFEKAAKKLMRITATKIFAMSACLFVAACAPTFESHIDSPAAPPELGEQSANDCKPVERPMPITIAPLDPRPQLPDADQSPCPEGSGLYACFMLDQDLMRQKRFKILHDDREYCRAAYDKAIKRAAEAGK
jgi:hypothetical protein